MIKKIFSLLILTAICAPVFAADKVAVVDVQKLISKSAQFKALTKEREAKSKEIEQFVKKANDDIKAQADENKKKELVKKYEKDLTAKREANAKIFKAKIEAFDKTVSATISEYAKTHGYDVVIKKDSILYGGDDITEALSKVVK